MRRISSLTMGVVLALAAFAAAQESALEPVPVGLRGVYFIPNHGQWSDDDVYYAFKSRGLDVACRESSLTMHLSRERSNLDREPGHVGPANRVREAEDFDALRDALPPNANGASDESCRLDHLTLTITFPGSNPVTPRGMQPQAARFNYFVGGEGRASQSDLPSYGAVAYEGLYDGIDLLVCGNDTGVLKYEFHVAPGADHAQIRIAYDGIDSLCVRECGDLEITTAFGTLMDKAPHVWHDDAIARASGSAAQSDQPKGEMVPARFDLIDEHTYRILLDGPVDPTRGLIIDPDVEWMRYLGGVNGREEGRDVAVDANGNSLVTGWTNSTDFDGRTNTLRGGWDAFVSKVDPAGQVVWMTYLGGSSSDFGNGIAVDASGSVYVAGTTSSIDFERRNNERHGSNDAFIAKVKANGDVSWMTYLGGSLSDTGHGISLADAGGVFLAGQTHSLNFEGRLNDHYPGNVADAYVAKVDASGTTQWMRYVGGTGGDEAESIATNQAGDPVIVGTTDSIDLELRRNRYQGSVDAFVATVASTGSLQWSRYLGGGSYDYVGPDGVAVDLNGDIYVTGQTGSTNFEGRINTFHGGYEDVFLVRLSESGGLRWMSYQGGSGTDYGYGLAMDSVGDVYLTGLAGLPDFEGQLNQGRGSSDAFLAKVGGSGAVVWMIYIGGSNSDSGFAVALDGGGSARIAGTTRSGNFERRLNSHGGGGSDEAFLVRVRVADGPRLTVNATCPDGGPLEVSWSDATPNGQVALAFAREMGSFRIPDGNPCAGTQLGLGANQIHLAWQGAAGPDGARTLNANAGPVACGGHLQLLDLTLCATSNVVRLE